MSSRRLNNRQAYLNTYPSGEFGVQNEIIFLKQRLAALERAIDVTDPACIEFKVNGTKRLKIGDGTTEHFVNSVDVKDHDLYINGDSGMVWDRKSSSSQFRAGVAGQFGFVDDQTVGTTSAMWAYGSLTIDSTSAAEIGKTLFWGVKFSRFPEGANPGTGFRMGLQDVLSTQDPDVDMDETNTIIYTGDGTIRQDGVELENALQTLSLVAGDSIRSIEWRFTTDGKVQLFYSGTLPAIVFTAVGSPVDLTPGISYRLILGQTSAVIGDSIFALISRPIEARFEFMSEGIGVIPNPSRVVTGAPMATPFLNVQCLNWDESFGWSSARENTTDTVIVGVPPTAWHAIAMDPAVHTTHRSFAFRAEQINGVNTPIVRYLGSCAKSLFQVQCIITAHYAGNGTRTYEFALGLSGVADERTISTMKFRGQNIDEMTVPVYGFLDFDIQDYVEVFVRVPSGTIDDILVQSVQFSVREMTNIVV